MPIISQRVHHLVRGTMALLLLSLAGASLGQSSHVRGRLLVKFKEGTSPSAMSSAFAGAYATQEGDVLGVKILRLPSIANESAVLQAFARRSDVEFAEFDNVDEHASVVPNDPCFPIQWALSITDCKTAWGFTTGSSSVPIAILDTGVFGQHQDFAGRLISGWNAVDGNADTSDCNSHGTMVAGVAGAAANNGVGVASVAWNSPIMPIRVAGSDGMGTHSAMATGLKWAADRGVKIANLSFMLSRSSTLDNAMIYFRNKGGLIFSGAGNTAKNTGQGENPYVLTASATDGYDALANFSSYGNNVDMSAPGQNYTTSWSGSYTTAGGTSFSAPMLAGAAALIWSANPLLSNVQVEQILRDSSDDLGQSGWDPYFGSGRLNVGRAVQMALGVSGSDATPPTISIVKPASNGSVSGSVQVWAEASDNVQVDSVVFYVNGAQAAVLYAPPYAFDWNTGNLPDGSASVKAVARDHSGNSSSTSVSVNVANSSTPPDTTAPAVSIVSPSSGSTVSGQVTVSVQAQDDVQVVKVVLYVDGKASASSTVAPFDMVWNANKAKRGNHSLVCKAYDAAGNVGTSGSVSVRK